MLDRSQIRLIASRHVSPLRPPDSAQALFGVVQLTGAVMPIGRGEEVYSEGECAEYIYKIVSGSVCSYRILSDGRRQICAFHLPGDIFGLEAGDEHGFSAEAICSSSVLMVKRSAVLTLAAKDPAIAGQLWKLTVSELQKMEDHVMLLVKTAQERVASFLLQMAQGVPEPNEIELPMSRREIADYLGLTVETVSRTLKLMQMSGTIALRSSRRVVLRDRSLLKRLNA